ncbi:uncharacterized protein LOC105422235 [Pogonomyrmex barbatus]|uniref:Uncharacterized protein LOC105422235 n=1 Tax=Pogonomyrmex barbatus TaxID=144034 RepID=A0A6I9VQQ8_9HYME|nr:uncharacterized protein LOC105422235 [Pogonomyrmex barbatus]
MTDRVKLLIQKRTSLKAQITNLTNIVERGKHDRVTLKMRMDRVTSLYHAYEEFNDELTVLNPDDNHRDEFNNVQEKFYSLAGKVEDIINPNMAAASASTSSVATISSDSGTMVVAKRQINLPIASLPCFECRYENWLSFKNLFLAMIDTRTDLSDVEKLQYLKSTLIGDATNKLKILSIEGSNYSKAWELLKRAYEVKRILISRHLSLLINLPALERETTDGLSKLADDAQQHVASLNALGVVVNSEILVNLIEDKLPKFTAEKWEETLDRDEFPRIDDLYEFLYRTAVRVSKRSRIEDHKRDDNKYLPPAKRGRILNKVLLVNATNNCVACRNKKHPLFQCDKFKQLDVSKRVEVVKRAKLCYNCLRSHQGKFCNYSNCTICQRRHNTLLHFDKRPTISTVTETGDAGIVKSE